MDQIKPVAKLSSLPPWQNYRVNRLSDSIGAIEKLFTMTKFPPVCLLVVQALRPVSGSRWHLFSADIIPGDIACMMQWSLCSPLGVCLLTGWWPPSTHRMAEPEPGPGPHLVRRSGDPAQAPRDPVTSELDTRWSMVTDKNSWTSSSSSFIVGI